jgi:hypothetical protein
MMHENLVKTSQYGISVYILKFTDVKLYGDRSTALVLDRGEFTDGA